MKKWLWYSAFLHIFILLWITSFCTPPGAEVHDAKSQQQLERRKNHFTEKNLNRLQTKVDKMQDMKNEMIHLRNKRLRQLEKFEQEVQKSFTEKRNQAGERAQRNQAASQASTENALSEIQRMNRIQDEMRKLIEANQYYEAMRKSADVAEQANKSRNSQKTAIKNSEETLQAFQKYEQLLSWMKDESEFHEINRLRRKQENLNKDLKSWQKSFKSYTRNLEKKADKFQREANSWKEPDEIANWKQWSKKRELNQFVEEKSYDERLEETLNQQKDIQRDFEKLANSQKDSLKPEDFKLTELPEFSADSTGMAANADLESLYYESKDLESDINELFRQTRSAELSMIMNIPYENAMTKIPGAKSKDENINPSLSGDNIKNQKDFNRFQNAFTGVAQNINSTYATAAAQKNKLTQSNTSFSDQGVNGGLAQTRQKQIRNLARDAGYNQGGALDLSANMKSIMAPVTVAENTEYLRQNRSVRDTYYEVNRTLNYFRDVSGQKITANGRPATWFYIHSWHIIGPFPNPERRNIEAKFPPEFGIDLDAAYPGKSGRIVQWQYMASPSHIIIPEKMEQYAIYYACTELYCEKATDLWIAIGSDDRSDVWINDLPVWTSSNALKSVQINEGFRKVHFQQGNNKILVRLENAWREGAFSFLICAQPEIQLGRDF